MNFSLNNQEKIFLLELARTTIQSFLKDNTRPIVEYFSETLKTETGVFVTLHSNKKLRGCIGYVQGYKPLQDSVIDMAISSAFNDPRFMPVSNVELDKIEIEISVLTPLTKVEDTQEIVVGRDGLLIKQIPYEGLLLPQVATEHEWDVDTFLEQTCYKAGLNTDAWKESETQIFKFSVIVFSEKEFN